MRDRADVNYSGASILLRSRYSSPKYPLKRLGDLADRVQYGTSVLASSEPPGLPVVRMSNLQDDGWDFSDIKYVSLPQPKAETYRLRVGDILFNRTNSKELVGKCEVFREPGIWVFASYLIRLELDEVQALPEFVSGFLNTVAARLQIDRVSRQIIGMSNINAEEIRKLTIPLPPLDTQRRLVEELNTARDRKARKLAEADGLLSGSNAFVLEAIGLPIGGDGAPSPFGVRLRDVAGRLDVDFNSPRFRELRRRIDGGVFPVATVEAACPRMSAGFAAGRGEQAHWEEDGIPHIRPLNISPHGELHFQGTKYVPRSLIGPEELIAEGDVLLNNTNSTQWVGKTAVFEGARECCCSNHITRLTVDRTVAEPHYLAALFNALRSTGYFGLLATNFVNQAGLNTATLAAVRIPLPPMQVQQTIATEILSRRRSAVRLREAAALLWREAKTRLEEQVLGERGRP